jgi:hypothetical protein
MRDLWTDAGLRGIDTRTITVQRTYADFDDYWTTIRRGPSVSAKLAAMTSTDLSELETRMRRRLPADAAGRITCTAWANAVRGGTP